MSAHGKDEEQEFPEDYSSKRSSTAEQEQGLLGGWKEQGAEDDEELISPQRRPWSSAVWPAVAAAVVVAVIVSIGFVFGMRDGAEEEHAEDLGVQTNDYILDPDWDFDAPPQRREYNWTVRDQVHNPDGIYRPMMLVNDQFPGPLIEANEGDTIVVHVDNQAVNATVSRVVRRTGCKSG